MSKQNKKSQAPEIIWLRRTRVQPSPAENGARENLDSQLQAKPAASTVAEPIATPPLEVAAPRRRTPVTSV